MDEATKRDFYNLWWEYLKRNTEYREKIALHKKKGRLGTVDPPDNHNQMSWVWEILGGDHNNVFEKETVSLPDNFLRMNRVWKIFGDVHNNLFENWWDAFKLQHTNLKKDQPVVIHFEEQERLSLIFEKAFGFRRNYLYGGDQDARYDSFEDYMLESFMGQCIKSAEDLDWPKLDIKLSIDLVDPSGKLVSTNIILNEIKKILHEIKGDAVFEETLSKYRALHGFPTNFAKFGELKQYLRVYDLREKGVKWKDIMADNRIGGSHRSYEKENDRRLFQLYLSKAKKIITNAAFGSFPGDYQ
jgi:hypothetical protein